MECGGLKRKLNKSNVFQLCFKKGDVITVTQKDDGWWEGTFDGKTGWFPSNYVKECKGELSKTLVIINLIENIIPRYSKACGPARKPIQKRSIKRSHRFRKSSRPRARRTSYELPTTVRKK